MPSIHPRDNFETVVSIVEPGECQPIVEEPGMWLLDKPVWWEFLVSDRAPAYLEHPRYIGVAHLSAEVERDDEGAAWSVELAPWVLFPKHELMGPMAWHRSRFSRSGVRLSTQITTNAEAGGGHAYSGELALYCARAVEAALRRGLVAGGKS